MDASTGNKDEPFAKHIAELEGTYQPDQNILKGRAEKRAFRSQIQKLLKKKKDVLINIENA